MLWRWTASSRAACGHSPKTLWPPFTRAGELDEADAFRRLYSSISCGCRRWNGEYYCYGRCGVTKREMTEEEYRIYTTRRTCPKGSGGKESHVMEVKSLTLCINVMNAKMPHVINSSLCQLRLMEVTSVIKRHNWKRESICSSARVWHSVVLNLSTT
jgi:hypothetical protein